MKMGKIHDLIDTSRDFPPGARASVEVWLSEFALEYSKAGEYGRIDVVKKWFGT